MVRFWSLGRSGLLPVEGRGSWRAARAALRSCGLPRPVTSVDWRGSPGSVRSRVLSLRLEWSSGPLFRCWLAWEFPLPPKR